MPQRDDATSAMVAMNSVPGRRVLRADEVFFSLQVGLIARVTASSRFFQPEFF
jgi:hypothetical protein